MASQSTHGLMTNEAVYFLMSFGYSYFFFVIFFAHFLDLM
jgi:hypothetical protein